MHIRHGEACPPGRPTLRRPCASLPPGGDLADLHHSSRVLVTQDVTVVDEVTEDGERNPDDHARGNAGPALPFGHRSVTAGPTPRNRNVVVEHACSLETLGSHRTPGQGLRLQKLEPG